MEYRYEQSVQMGRAWINRFLKDQTELKHYGVKGMKWGVHNGPPYPINRKKVAIRNHRDKIKGLQFFAEKDLSGQKDKSIQKGIKSLEKKIQTHQDKMENPEKYVDGWNNLSTVEKEGCLRHWEKEIEGFRQNIENRNNELKKRGKQNG